MTSDGYLRTFDDRVIRAVSSPSPDRRGVCLLDFGKTAKRSATALISSPLIVPESVVGVCQRDSSIPAPELPPSLVLASNVPPLRLQVVVGVGVATLHAEVPSGTISGVVLVNWWIRP